MTSVEDKVRAALRGKADQVPPGVVPPLRLPARRRRPFSLAYGGGGRNRAPAWRGLLAAAACAAAVAAVAAGSVTVSHVLSGQQDASGQQTGAAAVSTDPQARNEAAAWVAAQVSRSAVVACDPVMCRVLTAHGVSAGQLLVLGPAASDPLGSALIVVTAQVRGQFGGGLAAYAPAVLASFGSGAARVSIQVTSPHGAASYLSALRADVASRNATARALLSGHRITFSAAAKRQVTAGQVDTRLMIAIEGIAPLHPVVITAFRDAGPGASPGIPLRSADLAVPGGVVASSPYMTSVIKQLATLSGPFRPARVQLVRHAGGQQVLRIEFAAPSPLGLLGPSG